MNQDRANGTRIYLRLEVSSQEKKLVALALSVKKYDWASLKALTVMFFEKQNAKVDAHNLQTQFYVR